MIVVVIIIDMIIVFTKLWKIDIPNWYPFDMKISLQCLFSDKFQLSNRAKSIN